MVTSSPSKLSPLTFIEPAFDVVDLEAVPLELPIVVVAPLVALVVAEPVFVFVATVELLSIVPESGNLEVVAIVE